ncbi:restriction endonuclease [Stenotrophomonas sp. MMGLT7]|uniref:restriction endonuclease n=1 Tax=Stenotrophomonas sp. MMGLT7 TaxID=2901227 RepID=UPI001E301104|nr:restriction endonuclease [Stenotrophomonas sp. MMGLT7]MCD7097848.1 restriction endonuclease [Stenotrophomonas sp. MMGLT7]
MPVKRFRMGELYRYARPPLPELPEVDGISNFHHVVAAQGFPRLQLERGINAPSSTLAVDGERLSVVLLSSNENKRGSVENPWHDTLAPDDGFARYFGDNKTPEVDPSTAIGNRTLLRQFELHTSPDRIKRERAAPILLFRSSKKGFKEFSGLALIIGARRVTQFSEKNGGFFTNYLFDLAVLSLTQEDESLAMQWIHDRRDPTRPSDVANATAPKAWRQWVKFGSPEIERVKRRVARYHILPKRDQIAPQTSETGRTLEAIYRFYEPKRYRFEALASLACESMVRGTGAEYHRGWLTRGTGDGGLDFVGRIDIGDGLCGTKLVVLGQAKCEKIDAPTGGVHIARTVARLRRGWVGAYVTTSFFSEAVQREVYDDQYPVLLLNGVGLANEVTKLRLAGGFASTEQFLGHVDADYETQVSSRRPEEVLWD